MRLILAFLSLCVALTAGAQEKSSKKKAGGHPPVIEGTKSETYRKIGDTELKVWVFDQAPKQTAPRPAIVFFFGGGWTGGSPTQFEPQSRHLAERGMIAIVADYRVKTRQDAKPADCVSDAKACVRWVRANAARLGIDPQRIAVGGGSAGGHLAAFATLVPGLDDSADDLKVSPKGNALVLFNPVFNNGPGQWGHARVGERYREFSPAHHVTKDAPPAIVFLGDKDDLIPVSVLEDFKTKMQVAGVRCDTRVFPGAAHGFFNKDADGIPGFSETLADADRFLVSLGWLPAKATP